MKRFCALGLTCCLLLFSCKRNKDKPLATLFELISPKHSGISFQNTLTPTEDLNMYIFKNYYNGGGVAIGDVNNDGLEDIYFTGNQVDNKLYLNKGNFQFEDITQLAGVSCSNVWSTGASFVDINQDGLLDLYVCKSGPPEVVGVRHNELFINNGDLTFTEQSADYGLDFTGLGVHAVFFDYDKDNDLDCYLLNNSIRSVGGYDLIKNQRDIPSENGNKLLNNQSGKFLDVTQEAGIYSSEIGFGLGVTIGDINQDGWQDMYVSNDYFEKDYLYINQQNGTFKEELENYFSEISLSSMGADFADLNNDAYPDLFVTDMLPEPIDRYRTKTNFMSWKRYALQQREGYFNQFVRNSLQINREGLFFQEVSRFAHVPATDWSWGALIFDFDNNGQKDIFVANGIGKDLTDQDYVNFYANRDLVKRQMEKEKKSLIMTLMDEMPSQKLPNYAFVNQGGQTPVFDNQSEQLGLSQPSFSNGSAYVDLDNDGDLDLVVNNVDDDAFIYRNQSTSHYIKFDLTINEHQLAHGAVIKVFTPTGMQYQEIAPYRGFQSCVDPRPNFGLGDQTTVDSVFIEWPNGAKTNLAELSVDSTYQFVQPALEETIQNKKSVQKTLFTEINQQHLPAHFENTSAAFDDEPLLLRTRSKEGPRVALLDVNKDGLEDIYMPGAKNIPGKFLIQQKSGDFKDHFDPEIRLASAGEEVNAHAFDANGDGLMDLYVCFGGDEYPENSTFYQDKLYIHQPNGQWKTSTSQFSKTPTSVAISDDIDGDGDLDLFVAQREIPGRFGLEVQPKIWINDGQGNFKEDENWSKSVKYSGFITDAQFIDLNADGKKDLFAVGEWGAPTLFYNTGIEFRPEILINLTGFWNRSLPFDVDHDGDLDFVLGNLGQNSFLKAQPNSTLKFFVDDFDHNGEVEQFVTRDFGGKDFTFTLRDELVSAVPELKKKYLKFKDYQSATIQDMFGPTIKPNFEVDELRSGWLESTPQGYVFHPFLDEAQLFPIFAITAIPQSPAGNQKIILAGNYGECKPQVGAYLSGRGLVLQLNNGDFEIENFQRTGLVLPNEVRDFAWTTNQRKLIVINNNAPIKIFEINE